jgi:hypothetical protein
MRPNGSDSIKIFCHNLIRISASDERYNASVQHSRKRSPSKPLLYRLETHENSTEN